MNDALHDHESEVITLESIVVFLRARGGRCACCCLLLLALLPRFTAALLLPPLLALCEW